MANHQSIYRKVVLNIVAIIIIIDLFNYINISFDLLNRNLSFKLNKIDVINNLFQYVNIKDISEMIKNTDKQINKIDNIVIHHDEIKDTVNEILNINIYHQTKGFKTISYHYYIDRLGQIWQLHQDNEMTYHTADFNKNSISVCFAGNFNFEKLNDKQKKQGEKLIFRLMQKHNISIQNVYGHRELNFKTDCPGINFNLYVFKYEISKKHCLINLIKKSNENINYFFSCISNWNVWLSILQK